MMNRKIRLPSASAGTIGALLGALAVASFAATPATVTPALPGSAAASAPLPLTQPASTPKRVAPSSLPRVDINSASRAELKTLPGIGNAEADKIIANRPYLTKTELVSKGVLGTGPYVSLKDRVIAVQKGPLPAPKP